jgi:hypothetical protein
VREKISIPLLETQGEGKNKYPVRRGRQEDEMPVSGEADEAGSCRGWQSPMQNLVGDEAAPQLNNRPAESVAVA